MAPPSILESPKHNIITCKSGASLVGHDQSGLSMALKTCHGLQLTCLHYISLTKAITCWEVPLSTFLHVNEMLLRTGVS